MEPSQRACSPVPLLPFLTEVCSCLLDSGSKPSGPGCQVLLAQHEARVTGYQLLHVNQVVPQPESHSPGREEIMERLRERIPPGPRDLGQGNQLTVGNRRSLLVTGKRQPALQALRQRPLFWKPQSGSLPALHFQSAVLLLLRIKSGSRRKFQTKAKAKLQTTRKRCLDSARYLKQGMKAE